MVERQQEKEEGSRGANGNWISLFLAKIQASRSRTLPPGFHAQGRAGMTTHRSPRRAATLEMLALLSCLFCQGREWAGSPAPGPSQWEGLLRFLEENNAGELGGSSVSGLAVLGRMAPQEVRATRLNPQLWMVSTAQLSEENACHGNSFGQLGRTPARPLSPAVRRSAGRSAGRSGSRGRRGLAGGQGSLRR